MRLCRQELYGNCHESNPAASAVGGIFGYSHTAGGYDGGQAEYVRVPFADVGPTVVPDGMDLDDAVMLTDVVPTGYQAAEMGGIQPGDTVVVFGAGPIGIMAAKCAWLFGAARVIVIDREEYRLEFVRRYASCEAYNFESLGDPVVFVKRATEWLGPHVCIDAVGAEAGGSRLQTIFGRKLLLEGGAATALHWAINSVKKGGIVSIVGVYGPIGTLVPIGNVVNKGITIRANQVRSIPKRLSHIAFLWKTWPMPIACFRLNSMDALKRCSCRHRSEHKTAMQDIASNRSHIKGWRVDADSKNDPTYPMRRRLAPSDDEPRQRPAQQPIDMEILRSIERSSVTAVFGTSTPPAGLSGIVRRAAFSYSESSYLHWLPLMLADRIGVVEGVIDDLRHGRIPNVFAESGGRARWRHDRARVLRRLLVRGALLSAAAGYLRSRRRASSEVAHGASVPTAGEAVPPLGT